MSNIYFLKKKKSPLLLNKLICFLGKKYERLYRKGQGELFWFGIIEGVFTGNTMHKIIRFYFLSHLA